MACNHWTPRLLVDWRLLVKEHIAKIGIPLDVFAVLPFQKNLHFEDFFLLLILFVNQSTAHSWGVSRRTTGYEPLVDPQSDSRLQSLNPNSRFLIQTLNQTPDSRLWIQTSYSESRLYAYCFWRCLKAFGGSFLYSEGKPWAYLIKSRSFSIKLFFFVLYIFYYFFPFKGT